MQEDDNKETNVKATIDAVTGLIKAVPVYQDTLQPAAKQIGKSLETVTKTVNIALAPIKALVWGYEKIENFISTSVSDKLKNVAEEDIISPPIEIAGPAVEALRFTGHEVNLRELFANLLASSMDKNTTDYVHPGFVEILKNLSSDEALLLQAFINVNYFPLIDVRMELKDNKGSKVEYSNFSQLYKLVDLKRPDLIPNYIDNLCRLGLTVIPPLTTLTDTSLYEPLENDLELEPLRKRILDADAKVNYQRKYLLLTMYGKQFRDYVVTEK